MVDFHAALVKRQANAPQESKPPQDSESLPSPWRCVVCGEMHPAEDTRAMLILRSPAKTWIKWEVCQSCAPGMGRKLNDMAAALEERECRQP